MHLSSRGHSIGILDNYSKRKWELELNAQPLIPVASLRERVQAWQQISGQTLCVFEADLCDYTATKRTIAEFAPDAIVHFADQPSAPFSMIDCEHAVTTQTNNVIGTLNLLWSLQQVRPNCHLVKLGTMGEYGTPNIDIEEGWIEIEHNGRKDQLPFPCQPGSFYHLSKLHSSHNIRFACHIWGLRVTELQQGVVYGIDTPQTSLDERLRTSFHYDEVFGTVLNRFCVESIAGVPLTVYGSGHQKRSFLNINDTLQCVEIALSNAPTHGQYRVFNQFTEVFSIRQLAEAVQTAASHMNLKTVIHTLDNPRVEKEEHYYNPVNDNLLALGLKPRFLSDVLLHSMLVRIQEHRHRIRRDEYEHPRVRWEGAAVAKNSNG
jgi:UDP-sulfoquinovose synthase